MKVIESLFSSAMILLAMVVVLSAIAILLLAEARWIMGLSMQLYWRWRANIRQVHHDIAHDHEPRQGMGQHRQPETHPSQPGNKPRSGLKRINNQTSSNGDDAGGRKGGAE